MHEEELRGTTVGEALGFSCKDFLEDVDLFFPIFYLSLTHFVDSTTLSVHQLMGQAFINRAKFKFPKDSTDFLQDFLISIWQIVI